MNVPWYLSRSAGLIAYLLVFLTVVLGLSIRTKGLDRYVARWKVTDIHTFLSILAIAFVFFHAGILLWDGFVGYSLIDILVPFATAYRTLWTGVGIITCYLLIAVAVSFPLRRYIGYRAWRSLHYTTFAIYVAALVHGIYTGTDSRVAWAQLLYISTGATVLGLVIYRIAVWARRENASLDKVAEAARARRAPANKWFAAKTAALQRQAVEGRAMRFGVGAVAVTALLFIAAGLGPFQWGRSSAAGLSTASTANPGTTPAPAAVASIGFTDTFSGTASEVQQPTGATSFSLKAQATGDRPVAFDLELQLVADASGRTTATSNSMVVTAADGSPLCTGQVQRLGNQGFIAVCAGSGPFNGKQLQVVGSFDTGLAPQVTGTLQASAG